MVRDRVSPESLLRTRLLLLFGPRNYDFKHRFSHIGDVVLYPLLFEATPQTLRLRQEKTDEKFSRTL